MIYRRKINSSMIRKNLRQQKHDGFFGWELYVLPYITAAWHAMDHNYIYSFRFKKRSQHTIQLTNFFTWMIDLMMREIILYLIVVASLFFRMFSGVVEEGHVWARTRNLFFKVDMECTNSRFFLNIFFLPFSCSISSLPYNRHIYNTYIHTIREETKFWSICFAVEYISSPFFAFGKEDKDIWHRF